MKVNNTKLNSGDVYAVHTGEYAGEMLIFIKSIGNDYCFLSVPVMKNRVISKIVFNHGRNSNILRYVERVPSYVITTSTAQYAKNENTNNRRQQPDSQDVLDGKDAIKTYRH